MISIPEFMPIVTSLLSAAGGATAAGVFKGPIQTLQDNWYIHYGHKSSREALLINTKTQVEAEIYAEKLKNDLLKEVTDINPNDIREPELIILGPALEASRYYIKHEELRMMFAKLIASSMDNSKINITHSAYVQVIQQLTPLDAQNLKAISNVHSGYTPISNIKLNLDNGSYNIMHKYLFMENSDVLDQKVQGPSINNLQRLGLIDINFDQILHNVEAYEVFKNLSEYKEVEDIIAKNNIQYKELQDKVKHPQQDPITGEVTFFAISNDTFFMTGPELQKGIISLTPFGQNFCSTCF